VLEGSTLGAYVCSALPEATVSAYVMRAVTLRATSGYAASYLHLMGTTRSFVCTFSRPNLARAAAR
jgi:hypothetical protein